MTCLVFLDGAFGGDFSFKARGFDEFVFDGSGLLAFLLLVDIFAVGER